MTEARIPLRTLLAAGVGLLTLTLLGVWKLVELIWSAF